MIERTDLRQTGVVKVELYNGKEKMIPLFSKDVKLEAYNFLKEGKVKKIIGLWSFDVSFEKVGEVIEREGLEEDLLKMIKTGIVKNSFSKRICE